MPQFWDKLSRVNIVTKNGTSGKNNSINTPYDSNIFLVYSGYFFAINTENITKLKKIKTNPIV